jgi:anti-sigma regulatory factor (Ser/Thr protein kinase)
MLQVSDDDGRGLITVGGSFTAGIGRRVFECCCKLLADSPGLIVIDLRDVRVLTPSAVGSLLRVADEKSAWPETVVAVVAIDEVLQSLERVRVSRRMPCFASLHDARNAEHLTPDVRCDRIKLAGTPEAARLARGFARRRCSDLPDDVLESMLVVVTELVTNSVLHVGGDLELKLVRYDGRVRISVRDAGGGIPQIGQITDSHGRGLRIVNALSRRWGVLPTPTGGKIVWSELMVVR